MVFIGKVIRIVSSYTQKYPAKIKLYTFEVKEYLKGDSKTYSKQITLANKQYNSCQYDTELNQKYLIFSTSSTNGFINTTVCDYNQELRNVTKDDLTKIK